jgi:transcription elongation GreA/GreB family factor
MGTRNERIQESIDNEHIPILPFELVTAKAALEGHVKEQRLLSKKLEEAMQQSSETWHDNAPAEAISNDSIILAGSAERAIKLIRDGDIYGYEHDDEVITLGSLVGVKYGDDPEIVEMFITGVSRELPDEHLLDGKIDTDREVICVTLSSPVGQAIFNKKVGDKVDISVNGRKIKITIVDVVQYSE